MADTATHLVDRVLPEVPVRQWVLSLPIPLRYRIAYDRELCSEVLGAFLRTVFSSLRRRAKEHFGVADSQSGSVSTLQRFGARGPGGCWRSRKTVEIWTSRRRKTWPISEQISRAEGVGGPDNRSL